MKKKKGAKVKIAKIELSNIDGAITSKNTPIKLLMANMRNASLRHIRMNSSVMIKNQTFKLDIRSPTQAYINKKDRMNMKFKDMKKNTMKINGNKLIYETIDNNKTRIKSMIQDLNKTILDKEKKTLNMLKSKNLALDGLEKKLNKLKQILRQEKK